MASITEVLNVAKQMQKKINEEIAPAVTGLKPALARIQDGVDALEKVITDLKLSGSLTPEQQAEVDEAFGVLTGLVSDAADVASKASDAVNDADKIAADAKDGIDEGVPPNPEVPPPVEVIRVVESGIDPSLNPHP